MIEHYGSQHLVGVPFSGNVSLSIVRLLYPMSQSVPLTMSVLLKSVRLKPVVLTMVKLTSPDVPDGSAGASLNWMMPPGGTPLGYSACTASWREMMLPARPRPAETVWKMPPRSCAKGGAWKVQGRCREGAGNGDNDQ